MPNKILNIGRLKELASGIVSVTAGTLSDRYCPTYTELTNGTIIPLADSSHAGIKISTYSVGDGKTTYASNQLVCECDITLSNLVALTINGVQGYTVRVYNSSYDSTVVATTDSAVFSLMGGKTYNIEVSRDNEYDVNINNPHGVIEPTALTYTVDAEAITTVWVGYYNEYYMPSYSTAMTLNLSYRTTHSQDYSLVITEGEDLGSVSNKTIVFNSVNTSLTDSKKISYKVVHDEDATAYKEGDVIQKAANTYTLTFNVDTNGSLVTLSDGQTAIVNNNQAVFTVVNGRYTYTVSNDSVSYTINATGTTIDGDITTTSPNVDCKKWTYQNESDSVLINNFDTEISMISLVKVSTNNQSYYLNGTNAFATASTTNVLFEQNLTTSERNITVTAICTNDTTVTASCICSQYGVINYALNNLTMSYVNDTVAASGGSTSVATTSYEVYAVYANGHQIKTDVHPTVTLIYSNAFNSIDSTNGTVTYDTRDIEVGSLITTTNTCTLQIDGYPLAKETVTAKTYQEANALETSEFDESTLKLSWSDTSDVTELTVSPQAQEKQLYATMDMVYTYTSGGHKTENQKLTIV